MLQRDGGNAAVAERALALRELIIPFGRSSCIALFKFEGAGDVVAVAARHQREGEVC